MDHQVVVGTQSSLSKDSLTASPLEQNPDHSSPKQEQPDSRVAVSETTPSPSPPSETAQSHSPNIDHGSLQRIPTREDPTRSQSGRVERVSTNASVGPVHSVFSKNQKLFIIFMASWAGFFSPVSGQIYFPALNPLAQDLHVSNSLINLTLTSYMVCLSYQMKNWQGWRLTWHRSFKDLLPHFSGILQMPLVGVPRMLVWCNQ